MSDASIVGADADMQPDLDRARRTALMAHGVLVKLQEMDLPESLNEDLATMSTDLGDICGAQIAFARQLEDFIQSSHDWEAVGNHLVDLRASIDHMAWHARSVRRPMNRIAQYAYRSAEDDPVESSRGRSPG